MIDDDMDPTRYNRNGEHCTIEHRDQTLWHYATRNLNSVITLHDTEMVNISNDDHEYFADIPWKVI